MRMTLNDKPFDLRAESPIVTRVKKLLDRTSLGTLMDTTELAKRLVTTPGTLRENANKYLSGYYLRVGNRSLYGSKETIVELGKELNDADGNGSSDPEAKETTCYDGAVQPGASTKAGGGEGRGRRR